MPSNSMAAGLVALHRTARTPRSSPLGPYRLAVPTVVPEAFTSYATERGAPVTLRFPSAVALPALSQRVARSFALPTTMPESFIAYANPLNGVGLPGVGSSTGATAPTFHRTARVPCSAPVSLYLLTYPTA